MDKIEVTSMSSKGQVVIPADIRESLGLKEGEKFVVVGLDDTVMLKKITMPSFDGFDRLIRKTRAFAKEKGIKSKDVKEAIRNSRR